MKFSNEISTLTVVLITVLLKVSHNDAFQITLQPSKQTLSIAHRQPVHLPRKSTRLEMSTLRNANPIILFQKVVRAPKPNQAQIFLPSLIEFIQNQFEVVQCSVEVLVIG